VLLDVFHIEYANIEVTFLAWRAKTLFKAVVPGDLASHQMFRFDHEFGITDTATWSDIAYNRAEFILRTIKEQNNNAQVDPLSPNSPNTNIILTSKSDDALTPTPANISHPKNEKRGSSMCTQ
jgi:hypothetical protein